MRNISFKGFIIVMAIICMALLAANTVQAGNASWYGKSFHGKRTASGSIYNQWALTAAHKTLPFGTTVRVTNVANKKSVVVKITDRGPFVHGRVIDLSRKANNVINCELCTVKLKVLKRGDGKYRKE